MESMISVYCENTERSMDVALGTSLVEVCRMAGLDGERRMIAAFVNNRAKELNYRIYKPVRLRFFDATTTFGYRVYQRTLMFVAQRAVEQLYPSNKLHIRSAIGDALYCELDERRTFSGEECEALSRRMEHIIAENIPIERTKQPSEDVVSLFRERGYEDKEALLVSRPRLYSSVHRMASTVGYFFGPLAPSTGYIDIFEVQPHHNGFYLVLPDRHNLSVPAVVPKMEKMFSLFDDYAHWVEVLGVPTVGHLNTKIAQGDAGEIIKIAEAVHEKVLASIADSIAEANRTRGVKLVLISGPSSSGKTTTAKRLGIQLRVLGLEPALIELDDYFVERTRTPRDENGEYDFEALEAIDLEQLNDHLARLSAGECVDIPRYDFISGTRKWHEKPLQLGPRSVLIMEGIHGLNPRLTPSIPDSAKFRIYASCFTSVAMDNISRIHTSDNRLLRRIIRDNAKRGYKAADTIARWPSVRRGEEKHIFPNQENADVMFNSSLLYEISVLRSIAEPLLREIPDTRPEYAVARALLKFLDNFAPIALDEIPPTSILREFIGGSSFKY